MPLEISPVLAGTYDTPGYMPPGNVASSQSDATDAVDSRRYTKFDRSAADAGSNSNFSFGDFLDMINPLEHIPVVSSIYREITGENINPVSRVAGDILYGGVAGMGSGIASAVGAVGDCVMESQTGKDTTGYVLAELFEDDKSASPASTRLAQADIPAAAAPAQKTADSARINARGRLVASAVAADAASAAQASMPSTGTSSPAAQMASASSAAGSGLLQQLAGNSPQGFPLNTNNPKAFVLPPRNLPYGGVMAPLQGNNMAVSLANSAPGLQMNHKVYTSLKSSAKPSALSSAVAAPAPPPASAVAANSGSSAYVSTAGPNDLPPALVNDLAALRAVSQYRSTASRDGTSSSSSGAGVDVVN